MTGHGEDPSPAEAEAAIWLARLHADDRSPGDERAFRRWLGASPAHAEAFSHLTAAWELAGGTQRAPYEIAALEPEARESRRIGRRQLVMGSAALVLAAAGGVGFWQNAVAGVYETELGEQKHVTLGDGTLIFLDTDSKVRVRYSDSSHTVELVRGRCNFRIAPDRKRLFVVDAAKRKVISERANVDVRRDGEQVQVFCIAGAALVTDEARRTEGRLTAGERLTAAGARTARVDIPDPNTAISWQAGELIFTGQSLSDVVAEMNRYSPTKLVVTDSAAGELKLSGVYRAGDNAQFARSITQLLPLSATIAPDEIRLASDKKI